MHSGGWVSNVSLNGYSTVSNMCIDNITTLHYARLLIHQTSKCQRCSPTLQHYSGEDVRTSMLLSQWRFLVGGYRKDDPWDDVSKNAGRASHINPHKHWIFSMRKIRARSTPNHQSTLPCQCSKRVCTTDLDHWLNDQLYKIYAAFNINDFCINLKSRDHLIRNHIAPSTNLKDEAGNTLAPSVKRSDYVHRRHWKPDSAWVLSGSE